MATAATIAPSAMAGRGGGAPERLEQDASYCAAPQPGPLVHRHGPSGRRRRRSATARASETGFRW